ncbi:uncharacterized protein LOC131633997 [Vicia villosa]|uniref:uncharacterized protein LOC131633997 n=1 Tax=Vicia villosa TaxID=3911 RepID=UPI00273A9A03|nr:uncharacterized protein LOC131633997 [Vicia villosa]
MNIVTYNIRGGGNYSKRKKISFLLCSGKIDVCFLQETKIDCVTDSIAKSFWGGENVEWTASSSVGAAGGMLILWKKETLQVNFSFRGLGYVGINITKEGRPVNLVNVYAPNTVVQRRKLWEGLVHRRNRDSDIEWCLGGDFNEVTSSQERLGEGVNQNRRGMIDFREFIESMGVVDVPCVGGKFTWFKDNGKAMSRLDRFLVTTKLIDVWGVIDQRIGARDISDHVPIRLFCGNIDWGPKPFRFNNAWLKHEDFKLFICSEWDKLKFVGRGDFVLFEKLKALKPRIKRWNHEVFGWIDLKIEDEVGKINELDASITNNFGSSSFSLVEDRKEATK